MSALSNGGAALFVLGDTDQARMYCEGALALAREQGNRSLEGVALRDLANLLAALDQATEADTRYVHSLAIQEELDDQGEQARTRWDYGWFLVQQGNRERGIDLMAACVSYEQRIGHVKAEEHAAFVEQLWAGGAQPG